MTSPKRIQFNRADKDYSAYYDDELIGIFATYHQAEIELDAHALDLLERGLLDTAEGITTMQWQAERDSGIQRWREQGEAEQTRINALFAQKRDIEGITVAQWQQPRTDPRPLVGYHKHGEHVIEMRMDAEGDSRAQHRRHYLIIDGREERYAGRRPAQEYFDAVCETWAIEGGAEVEPAVVYARPDEPAPEAIEVKARIITEQDIIAARQRIAENERKDEQQDFYDALLASPDLTPDMVKHWLNASVNVHWCACDHDRHNQIVCDVCGLPPYWKSKDGLYARMAEPAPELIEVKPPQTVQDVLSPLGACKLCGAPAWHLDESQQFPLCPDHRGVEREWIANRAAATTDTDFVAHTPGVCCGCLQSFDPTPVFAAYCPDCQERRKSILSSDGNPNATPPTVQLPATTTTPAALHVSAGWLVERHDDFPSIAAQVLALPSQLQPFVSEQGDYTGVMTREEITAPASEHAIAARLVDALNELTAQLPPLTPDTLSATLHVDGLIYTLGRTGKTRLLSGQAFARLWWRDHRAAVTHLATLAEPLLRAQAAAYLAYVASYTRTELTIEGTLCVWRGHIARARAAR